jgi:TetR/AcrR family transcriptional regulator, cholesterol catabolism regulator
MEDRTRRILETAISLAERDGFDAVRLRDVAAQAEVALGTVYRRFRSKEDILVAALEVETNRLASEFGDNPITGDDAITRTTQLFGRMTKALIAKPNLARALLRAVSSGVPENTERVAQFHGLTTELITAVMFDLEHGDEEHHKHLAGLLQDIWFAKLVGWAGGLQDCDGVIGDMRAAVVLLLNAPPQAAVGDP